MYKSAYLQISISTNQHICESAYLRISISTNQHICKSAYLQISISANQHICKSTLPKQYNAALVCFVVIKYHFAFDKIFYLRKDAFVIFRIDFCSGDID